MRTPIRLARGAGPALARPGGSRRSLCRPRPAPGAAGCRGDPCGPGPRRSTWDVSSDLPLPSRVPLASYEAKLFAFLNARGYAALGWRRDKGVRDTGPYLDGKSYGTHPAVRVFYSPGRGPLAPERPGRRDPRRRDDRQGAVCRPGRPARGQGRGGALWRSLESWTVMVKDSAGSRDGWFWSNPAKGQCVVDNHREPFDHPVSGFGHYCLRCHASPAVARRGGRLRRERVHLRVAPQHRRVPGRADPVPRRRLVAGGRPAATAPRRRGRLALPLRPPEARPATRPARPTGPSSTSSPRSRRADLATSSHLPPATHDWVVEPPRPGPGVRHLQPVHGLPFRADGPVRPVDVRPRRHFGRVRRPGPRRLAPRGMAVDADGPRRPRPRLPRPGRGRDPLDPRGLPAPTRRSPRNSPRPSPTPACAATGRWASASSTPTTPGTSGPILARSPAQRRPARASIPAPARRSTGRSPATAWAAWSATACSRPPGRRAMRGPTCSTSWSRSITGHFRLGEPGEIYGPLRDDEIAPYAMEHATGFKPTGSPFLRSSRLCASCHMVSLPNVDMPAGRRELGPRSPTSWSGSRRSRSSASSTTTSSRRPTWSGSTASMRTRSAPGNPKGRSCQDCHMSEGVKDDRLGIDVPRIRTRIAAIQDTTYPDAENLAPRADARRPRPRGRLPAAQLLGSERLPGRAVPPVRRRARASRRSTS